MHLEFLIEDRSARVLAEQLLPRILPVYEKQFRGLPAAVVVLIDADDHNCKEVLSRLRQLQTRVSPNLPVLFRLAIEDSRGVAAGRRSRDLQGVSTSESEDPQPV